MAELDEGMTVLGAAAQGLEGDLRRLSEGMMQSSREAAILSQGFGHGLRRAFEGLVFEGKGLSQVLTQVGRSLSDTAYGAAMRPVQSAVGGALGQWVTGAVGGALSQGKVTAFASGGVVSAPTAFPMQGGQGLMGEAGPEAILPLMRGADGRLGVQAGGGRAMQVVMHVSTPDVEGFRRSQSQLAAQMGRALGRGQRNA